MSHVEFRFFINQASAQLLESKIPLFNILLRIYLTYLFLRESHVSLANVIIRDRKQRVKFSYTSQ
jgi:hypothetical protein